MSLRLRLVDQLALLLAGAVLLTTLALGGLAAWNLRAGFSDYLRAQDDAWLQRFCALAAGTVAQNGLSAISGPPGSLRPLLEGLRDPSQSPSPRQAPPPAGPPGRWGPPDGRPPPPAEPPPPRDGGGAGGGGGGDPRRYGRRLTLATMDGQLLNGPPDGLQVPGLSCTIRVQGRDVAQARLRDIAPASLDVDGAFLARQYQGLIWAAVVAVLVAIGTAIVIARRWLRPVVQAQQAARRIAAGAFDVRLPDAGGDELGTLVRDINAMAASLQDLEASRRRWIAELSHELRTPLAVLRAELEALQDGVRQPDAAAVRSLCDEVARLSRLVDDFHQLALSDLRALPVQRAPVDVLPFVLRAIDRHRAAAREAGVSLDLESTLPNPSPLAMWDAGRINQLLDNLLHNSLRYTDAPGQVRLSVALVGSTVRLCLDDSEPGVPVAELPRLFDPLYRADPSRSRARGGSGLGLAICRALVASHDGTIDAAPSPWRGLRIVVQLPLHPRGGEA